MDAGEGIVIGDAHLGESLHACLVGAPAAHHAEVAHLAGERALDRRDVELGVVGEDAHRVGRAEGGTESGQHPVGPVDDDLVGQREAGASGEDLSGVADGDLVAEHLGDTAQRGGEVDRTEDDHAGREGVHVHEDADLVLVGLASRAVVAYARASGAQLAEGVAGDHAVEVGVAERALRRAVRLDEQGAADVGTVDDRGERHRPVLPEGGAQLVEQGHAGGPTSRPVRGRGGSCRRR